MARLQSKPRDVCKWVLVTNKKSKMATQGDDENNTAEKRLRMRQPYL